MNHACKGHVGQGFEQLDLVKVLCEHCKGVEIDDF